MKRKQLPLTPDEIEIVNAPRAGWDDIYHWFLRSKWRVSLALVVSAFTLLNLLFATLYYVTGGVDGARSFAECFFFAVETSATIGYGAMHPTTTAAHTIATVEAMSSVLLVAITTGVLFAKFSIPRARVRFATHPVISDYDGVPTLMFRIGNQRSSRMLEAVVRVVCIRTERTREGVTMYRMYDVKLERDRSPALARSWMVLHKLVEGSPLHGATAESMAREEVELIMTLQGIDEVSAQGHQAQRQWVAADIKWGVRYADMLSDRPDGGLRLDMARFDDVVPV